jgi:nucleoside-diphosphate-sugar epimerase
MKCVIIGLGWLGLPLAKELVASGFSVTGTIRQRIVLSDEINLLNYEPENGISTDLKRALTVADFVVLAFPPNRSSFEQYASDCVQIVGECSNTVRILMISSTGVYPEKNGFVVETDTDFLPDTTNSLLFAERSLGSILGNRLTIIRMAGLIGENRYPVRAMAASGKSYSAHELVNVVHQNDAVGRVHIERLSFFFVLGGAGRGVAHVTKPEGSGQGSHIARSERFAHLALGLELVQVTAI